MGLVDRRVIPLTAAAVVAFVVALNIVVATPAVSLDRAATYVDTVVKAAALIAGGAWALSRHRVERVDSVHLAVEDLVQVIPAADLGEPDGASLLILWLKVLNPSRVLVEGFTQVLHIDEVQITDGRIQLVPLGRWPQEGSHPGRPIEPGSWAAINHPVVLPPGIRLVRVHLAIKRDRGAGLTWHKTYPVGSA